MHNKLHGLRVGSPVPRLLPSCFGCIIWEELGRCTQGGHETKMGKGKGKGKKGALTQHSLLLL